MRAKRSFIPMSKKRRVLETYNPQYGYKEEFLKNFLSVERLKRINQKEVNVTTREQRSESVCPSSSSFYFYLQKI